MWLALTAPALAQDPIRFAVFATPLSRDGPGLLLRDIQRGEDAQIAASLAIVDLIQPDVLLLTNIDFDHGLAALSEFNASLDTPYETLFALPPNSGVATGLDMDGNGRTGEPRDAQGYGRFFGDGGIVLLSRFPVHRNSVTDFSELLWKDLPSASLPVVDGEPFPSYAAQTAQRLSSTGHWIVPLETPNGVISVLAYSATPPVFDGPEDLNGLRNRDELLLWEHVLDGVIEPRLTEEFVLLGNTNLDPIDGDGRSGAMAQFLRHPRLQDPQPQSNGAAETGDENHLADPGFDTVDWPDHTPGNLRVSYALPSTGLTIVDAGVFWPAPDEANANLLGEDGLLAGPHRLVWVDVTP